MHNYSLVDSLDCRLDELDSVPAVDVSKRGINGINNVHCDYSSATPLNGGVVSVVIKNPKMRIPYGCCNQ